MTTTTYSRTSGTAILPGTWAYVRARGDIPAADILNPAERYDYDQADAQTREAFRALALAPLTEPPDFLRFALASNTTPLAHYEGEGPPGAYVAPGVLAGATLEQAIATLGIDEATLQARLGTFAGPVTLAILPAGARVYRTVGLMASSYAVGMGVVTNKLLGDFWEPVSPNGYEDVGQWRSTTAVLAEWNGDFGHIEVCLAAEVPALVGTVAQQKIQRDGHHVLPGGGQQYCIPNLTDADLTEPLTGRPLKEIIRETRYGGRNR